MAPPTARSGSRRLLSRQLGVNVEPMLSVAAAKGWLGLLDWHRRRRVGRQGREKTSAEDSGPARRRHVPAERPGLTGAGGPIAGARPEGPTACSRPLGPLTGGAQVPGRKALRTRAPKGR